MSHHTTHGLGCPLHTSLSPYKLPTTILIRAMTNNIVHEKLALRNHIGIVDLPSAYFDTTPLGLP